MLTYAFQSSQHSVFPCHLQLCIYLQHMLIEDVLEDSLKCSVIRVQSWQAPLALHLVAASPSCPPVQRSCV